MTDATQFDGRPSSAPPIAVSSFPAVVEHACYLIYPLPVGEQPMGPTLTLGDLANTHASPAAGGKAAATRWLAPEALATITDERRARPVWEAGSLAPGDDLYPHVQRLLGGGTSAAADVLPSAESVPSPKSHTCVWRLSESGRKLVQGQRLDWLHLSQDLVPLAATAIGLVVAVVAALVTAMTGRHPHGLAEHAQHETVIHAAHH